MTWARPCRAGDALAVKRSAHRLKGALVSLGAKPSTEVARALELCGADGELGRAATLYSELEKEVSRLVAAIRLPDAA